MIPTTEERRECDVLASAGCSESDWCLSCSECSGGWHWSKYDRAPRYCPHCGRKIVKVTYAHDEELRFGEVGNKERREVAKRLRDWADDQAESGEIDFELCECEVTGADPTHAHDCARHIADLIDPEGDGDANE